MMKKYLMMGAVALVMSSAFVSCSSDKDVFDQEAVDQLVVNNYNKAFIKVFGQPAADQEWGFGSSTRATRAGECVKYDMTGYPMATTPAPITNDERTFVTNWFKNNPGLSEEGLDISNFYVQWVSGDPYNKKGMWHRYDQNRINNGYDSNYWDEEFTDNATLDYFVVGTKTDNVHLLDFNANGGGSFGIVYIEGGSAKQFGFHSSWDSNDYFYFKLAEIDVPGVGKGLYVGLSAYGTKYDNGEKELGIQRLQYAEDWIFKIVPGQTNAIRVFAEDLSASEATDFDFNDVIFDAEYVSATQAKITVWAAGGVLPLRINSNNGVGGFEVHEALGLGWPTDDKYGCMINTHAEKYGKDPYSWADNINKYETVITIPSGQFDVANFPAGVRDLIRVEVLKEGVWYELTANKGMPACKVAGPVGANNAIGIKWLLEKVSIITGYPNFAQYVGVGYPTDWWSEDVNDAALYGDNAYSTKCRICTE